jgi:hypothetical protein
VDQRVYSLGLRGRYDLERGTVDWQAYGELVRVGATARRPFDAEGTGRRADFLVYGFTDAYTDAPAVQVTAPSCRRSPRA